MTAAGKLGFIGVGNMGGPMATRLRQAGHDVTVCGSGKRDLTEFAAKADLKLASSPAETAASSDVVFTMVPDGQALLNVLTGESGVGKTDFTGKILVDMSTVDPDSSELAAALVEAMGGFFLRAPVTGSVPAATAGTLGIMVSGPKDCFDRCLPYLQVMGNRQTYLGPKEEARYMKIIINMLLAQILQADSEALVLAQKLGLPWETTIDLIASSAAGAPILNYKAESMKKHDFNPTSTGFNMHKDMKMAMDLGRKTDANLPTASITMQMYNSLMAMGMRNYDNTAILLVNETMNHLNHNEN